MLNGGKLHCGLQNDECRMQTEAFASAEPKMYILGFCTKGVTEMDIQSALKSQYHAALKTLRDEIEKCPEAMWNDPADGFATFWRVVYHALFFTDFYSLQDQKDFMPWSRARTEAHQLGMVPWEKGRDPKPCEPYTKQDLLEYWQVCDAVRISVVQNADAGASTGEHPAHSASCGCTVKPAAPLGGHQHSLGGKGLKFVFSHND
jgi:hypothetical protein